MKKLFLNKEAGTSLVELIIAAGLLGMVGMGAANFYNRLQASEYEAKAKASAISEISLYISAIERDFKLRDISATSTAAPICTGRCKQFSVERKVKMGVSDTNMKVTYDTICENIPNSMVSKFKDPTTGKRYDFTQAIKADDYAGQGACFMLAGCKGDKYPQLNIILDAPAGATLPKYPRLAGKVAKFPDLTAKTSAAANVIGAVACAESKMGAGSGGADRIILEVAYMSSEGKFRIEKREVSIPRSNVAKIQMLPTSNTP